MSWRRRMREGNAEREERKTAEEKRSEREGWKGRNEERRRDREGQGEEKRERASGIRGIDESGREGEEVDENM